MDDTKKAAIENLSQAHEFFTKILSNLSPSQITQQKIDSDWTTKDVIAHLSAWNIECLEEIDRILHGKSTWNKLYATKQGDDVFNKAHVAKRREWSWEDVKNEWESTYQKLMKRVHELSNEQWNHTLENEVWADTQEEAGNPVTIKSIFSLETAGNAHELEHAKEVGRYFNKLD